ncbi:MAG: catalase family peroxidase [Proteobacteria bacterium]|nr:catalase family peroxidase [Pseudomonadota bacterium]
MRATKAAVLLACLVAILPRAAPAQQPPVPEQIVDAMDKVYGVHKGFRANHAKGVVAEGTFTPSAEAASYSRAVLFAGPAVPVTVRFSDATGLPTLPDGAPNANPHGMAIKFHLPGGTDTDMVLNSLKFFPVATGEDFRDLLLAAAASPPDAPKPTAVEKFLAAHPSAPAALATVATPDSFADEEYYGVDAFFLVDKAGAKHAVRYIMQPEKVVHLDPAEAAKRAPDFLVAGLANRLAKGPAVFHLKAQLAEPGDPITDATKPWPAERKQIDLGVLTVTKVAADSAAAEKALLFLPGRLIDGIEASDDPLIAVRDGAYPISFARRLR